MKNLNIIGVAIKSYIVMVLLVFVVTSVSISCKPEPVQVQQPVQEVENIRLNSLGHFPYNNTNDEITIQEIDGCEYLVVNAGQEQQPAITHKGNCKYCALRAKAVYIPSVTDSIK